MGKNKKHILKRIDLLGAKYRQLQVDASVSISSQREASNSSGGKESKEQRVFLISGIVTNESCAFQFSHVLLRSGFWVREKSKLRNRPWKIDVETSLKSRCLPFDGTLKSSQRIITNSDIVKLQNLVTLWDKESRIQRIARRVQIIEERIKQERSSSSLSMLIRRWQSIRVELGHLTSAGDLPSVIDSPRLSKAFHGRFSPTEMECLWENLAHPKFNLETFSEQEDQFILMNSRRGGMERVVCEMRRRFTPPRPLLLVFHRRQILVARHPQPCERSIVEDSELQKLVRGSRKNVSDTTSDWTGSVPRIRRSLMHSTSMLKKHVRLLLHPVKVGRFSPEEDQMLKNAVHIVGKNFTLVAEMLPHRSREQWSRRYTFLLTGIRRFPRISQRQWNAHEDEQLLDAVDTVVVGTGKLIFSRICRLFNNTAHVKLTKTEVKSRFLALSRSPEKRKKLRKILLARFDSFSTRSLEYDFNNSDHSSQINDLVEYLGLHRIPPFPVFRVNHVLNKIVILAKVFLDTSSWPGEKVSLVPPSWSVLNGLLSMKRSYPRLQYNASKKAALRRASNSSTNFGQASYRTRTYTKRESIDNVGDSSCLIGQPSQQHIRLLWMRHFIQLFALSNIASKSRPLGLGIGNQ